MNPLGPATAAEANSKPAAFAIPSIPDTNFDYRIPFGASPYAGATPAPADATPMLSLVYDASPDALEAEDYMYVHAATAPAPRTSVDDYRTRTMTDEFGVQLFPDFDQSRTLNPSRTLSNSGDLERSLAERSFFGNASRTSSPANSSHSAQRNPASNPITHIANLENIQGLPTSSFSSHASSPPDSLRHQVQMQQQMQLQQLQQQHLQQLRHQHMQMQQMQHIQQMQQMQFGSMNPVLAQPAPWGHDLVQPAQVFYSHQASPIVTTTPPGAYGRFRANSDDSNSIPTPGSSALSNSASPNPHHLSPYGNQPSPSSHGSHGSMPLSASPSSGGAQRKRKARSRTETATSAKSMKSPGLSGLRMHSPDPSGAKPRKHQCNHDGCGKFFSSSGHLSRHVRIHLSGELARAALGAAGSDGSMAMEIPGMQGTMVDTDGSLKFPCPWEGCLSLFGRKDNLRSHFSKHHYNSRNEADFQRGLEAIADYREVKVEIENGIGRVVFEDVKSGQLSPLLNVPQIRHIPATPNTIAMSASQTSVGSQMLPGAVSSSNIGQAVRPTSPQPRAASPASPKAAEHKSVKPANVMTDLTDLQILSPGSDPLHPPSASPHMDATDLLDKIAALQQKLMLASDQLEKQIPSRPPPMVVSPSSGLVLEQGRLESLMDLPGTSQTNEFLRQQVQKLTERGASVDFASSTASLGTMNAANLLLGMFDPNDGASTPLVNPSSQTVAGLPKKTLTPENWFHG